jgi:hypothetical protein
VYIRRSDLLQHAVARRAKRLLVRCLPSQLWESRSLPGVFVTSPPESLAGSFCVLPRTALSPRPRSRGGGALLAPRSWLGAVGEEVAAGINAAGACKEHRPCLCTRWQRTTGYAVAAQAGAKRFSRAKLTPGAGARFACGCESRSVL